MKKLIALMLSLALMLSCSAVLAEAQTAEKTAFATLVSEKAAYTLQANFPEGYRLVAYDESETKYLAELSSDDETKPSMFISIAYNDIYSDVERLNDLDAEALETIKESFSLVDEVTFEERETAYGTKLLVVTEGDAGDCKFIDMYTIYKGYEIEFVLTVADMDSTLGEADIQMMTDIMSDLDFVEVK